MKKNGIEHNQDDLDDILYGNSPVESKGSSPSLSPEVKQKETKRQKLNEQMKRKFDHGYGGGYELRSSEAVVGLRPSQKIESQKNTSNETVPFGELVPSSLEENKAEQYPVLKPSPQPILLSYSEEQELQQEEPELLEPHKKYSSDTEEEVIEKITPPIKEEKKEMSRAILEASLKEECEEFIRVLSNPLLAMSERKTFLMTPLPKCFRFLECYIKRDRSGFSKKFYPKYDFFLAGTDVFVMSAQKMQLMRSAHYVITMERENMEKKAPGYLGKLRSNYSGTAYSFFDKGENPETKLPPNQIRNQLGAVIYESGIFTVKGPRQMHILLPEIYEDGRIAQWKPMSEPEHMIPKYEQGSRDRMLCLINKPPKWNPIREAYMLNFKGRVVKPSVKNFQAIEQVEEDLVLLQFGRVDDYTFNLDVRYPFSLFQAFALALSSFDYSDYYII